MTAGFGTTPGTTQTGSAVERPVTGDTTTSLP